MFIARSPWRPRPRTSGCWPRPRRAPKESFRRASSCGTIRTGAGRWISFIPEASGRCSSCKATGTRANCAIDVATATWIEREKKGEIKLDVADAGQDSGYLALVAFFENARGHKQPLNNADSAALSTLVAMMGRKSIYERRVVTWEEMG